MKMEEYMEYELSGIFPVKLVATNIAFIYSPWGAMQRSLCSVMSLSEETYKFCEPDY